MSCIQKLLMLKGDKEFLMKKVNSLFGVCIESGGSYKGYDYIIIFTSTGHRCGYVAIQSNHKLAKADLMNGKTKRPYGHLKVHGGITFQNKGTHVIKPFLKNFECDDIWIGFDAAHLYDKIDFDTLEKTFFKSDIRTLVELKDALDYRKHIEGFIIKAEQSEVRTNEYMENECKSMIDQIVTGDNLLT